MNKEAKKIFQYDPNDPIIACVGSNGGTFDINIYFGYNEAVKIIYENIRYNEDILVYPFVFSIRHVIELGMKIYIKMIKNMPTFSEFERKKLRKVNISSTLTRHDINNLYKAFIEASTFNNELKQYIRENKNTLDIIKAFSFDKKEDMFRYAMAIGETKKFNLKSAKISHIPINKLYKSYEQLYGVLTKIIYLCHSIYEEYKLGVYTTNLSKQDLVEITKLVSRDFKNNNFVTKTTKNCIKKKYHISNSEFDKAINIIKKHRYMASILGKEIRFKYNIDNINAIKIYCDFIKKHGINLPNKPTLVSEMPDASPPFKIMLTLLNTKQLKFLSTFVYLSKYDFYSVEEINQIYNNFKNFIDIRSFALQLVYVNGFNYFIRGLQLAGQTSYLELVKSLE